MGSTHVKLDVWTRPNSAYIRILMSDRELACSRGTCVGGGGGGKNYPLQLLYEPRFLTSSRPSNRIGKWCISGVSFIVARCTLVDNLRTIPAVGGII